MTEPKTRSFAEIAAAKRVTFISYREAIEKLAAATGDTLNEVAAGLKAADIHKHNAAALVGAEEAVRRYTGDAPITVLLDNTITHGTIAEAWYDMDGADARPDIFGWMREPFIASLREAGLPCPDSLSDAPSYRAKATPPPPWTKPFVSRHTVSLAEAARLVAGLNPASTYSPGAEERATLSQWDVALCDSIHAGEITLADGNCGEDLTDETLLSHASVRAWCARWDHAWPVPDVSQRPASDAGVVARLDEAHIELKKLRAELRAAHDEIVDLRAALPQVEGRLRNVIVAVGDQFWTQTTGGKRRPKADEIVRWIREKYPDLSEAEAVCAERAACPVDRDRSAQNDAENPDSSAQRKAVKP
jgi:hypothetical protein